MMHLASVLAVVLLFAFVFWRMTMIQNRLPRFVKSLNGLLSLIDSFRQAGLYELSLLKEALRNAKITEAMAKARAEEIGKFAKEAQNYQAELDDIAHEVDGQTSVDNQLIGRLKVIRINLVKDYFAMMSFLNK